MRLSTAIMLVICFALSFGRSGIAQVRNYAFQQLTEEQGLSQDFLYTLTQDQRGFLWIGTGAGLSRYDGHEIKVFSTNDSLSANFITADYRMASGNLLFGHNQGGVTHFDGIRFYALLPDTVGSKVVGITEDEGRNLWIATQSKGFQLIDHTRKRFLRVFPDVLQGKIINVTFFRGGVLWVGTNEGLFLFQVDGDSLELIDNQLLPAYVGVTSILQHDADTALCFVGTEFRGIFLLRQDVKRHILVQQHIDLPAVSGNIIQAMAQDPQGDLWLGTQQTGVIHLNIGRDGKSIYNISHFNNESGFPFSSVNRLTIDRQGQVWISTMGSGLFRVYKKVFTYFSFADRYGVGDVRSVAETSSGYLVATDKGLIRIRQHQQSDEYEMEMMDGLKGEPILAVFNDRRANIWIGTETKGIYLMTRGGNDLKQISIDPKNHLLEIRLFEEDNNGNIWMSARGEGVYVVDEERRLLKHLTTANRFIHNDIFAIKADSRGNIWFGTYGAGLAMMDKNNVLHLFSKQEELQAKDINDIDEDDHGNMWIATEGEGFFKYAGGRFTQIGTGTNLVSPFIKGIQFDPAGRIWFSYRKGIGYFDLQSEKKYHFSKEDGLLGNEAYSSSIIVDSKLNKWFCNDYGVTLFEHDTISESRRPLETYLTGVRIFFKDHPSTLRGDGGSGGSMGRALPPLKLTYDQNHVTFDFVAIQLNRSGKIYYRHLLKGYDTDWTPPETGSSITYTNLDPGKYTLQVQATDDLGVWVDPVTEYSFEITPPYWKRTWFYLLQIVSVVLMFTLTYLIGKKGIARKRFVLRLMLFTSFFITLEYVENFVDPLVSGILGGAPVFRFFLNFVLALLLLPVETIITHWLMNDERKFEQVQVGKDVELSETVLEENASKRLDD